LATDRVTRLGEFSPLRLFLSLGNFKQITRIGQILGPLFAPKSYVLNFTKHGSGFILGRFFHNSIWSPWLPSLRVRKTDGSAHRCIIWKPEFEETPWNELQGFLQWGRPSRWAPHRQPGGRNIVLTNLFYFGKAANGKPRQGRCFEFVCKHFRSKSGD
jgi:hypothetical protein